MRRVLALAVVGLIVACNLAEAQNTGVPLWGSFETSPFDIVNRQNLNVNLVMPIRQCSQQGNRLQLLADLRFVDLDQIKQRVDPSARRQRESDLGMEGQSGAWRNPLFP